MYLYSGLVCLLRPSCLACLSSQHCTISSLSLSHTLSLAHALSITHIHTLSPSLSLPLPLTLSLTHTLTFTLTLTHSALARAPARSAREHRPFPRPSTLARRSRPWFPACTSASMPQGGLRFRVYHRTKGGAVSYERCTPLHNAHCDAFSSD